MRNVSRCVCYVNGLGGGFTHTNSALDFVLTRE